MLISATNTFPNPKSTTEDKIDFLMNKITQLEEAFKEERKYRISAEDELKNLKTITIKNLQKQLDEKESMVKTLFIEKIQITKELLEFKKKNPESNKIIINNINNEKHDSLQSNKLEYYSNAYKDLKNKYNELIEEKSKFQQETEERIILEKKKNEILKDEIKLNEDKLEKYSKDVKSLSESNKNLLVELKSLNYIIDELNKQKEILLLEIHYFRNEHESSKSNLKDVQSRFRKLETEYKAISKNLSEMQIKMSNMDISSHIFNVIRIGRIYESNTDLVFTKDENNQMVLIIKYVTTSAKHNIHDIKEIVFKEGDENVVMLEYKPEKQLKNEFFRSSECASIIKVFHDYQKKAYEQMDTKKLEDQKNKKIENIGANLKDILSFP